MSSKRRVATEICLVPCRRVFLPPFALQSTWVGFWNNRCEMTLFSLKPRQKFVTTGEGGTLLLINGTAYTWKKGSSSSYQMTSWDFPSQIAPGVPAFARNNGMSEGRPTDGSG